MGRTWAKFCHGTFTHSPPAGHAAAIAVGGAARELLRLSRWFAALQQCRWSLRIPLSNRLEPGGHSDGPEVVFHDLINSDETLSLVIAPVDPDKRLEDLGSVVAVGEKLGRTVIAPPGSGREAELIEASEREDLGRTFYDLEYKVHLAERDRHELATVVADHGQLYTLAASTNEARWPKVQEMFHQMIGSFTLNY